MKVADLTVAIPFHAGTRPEELSASIESIVNQTLLPKHLILVQNGDVPEELSRIAQKLEPFPFEFDQIRVPKPGLPAALNASLELTRTRYYARMDSDDISHPNRFEVQMAYMTAHPETRILGGSAYEFTTTQGLDYLVPKEMPTDPRIMREWFHYRNPFIHTSIVFDMRVFKEIDPYDETFITDQDLEMWGRALKAGVEVANVPDFVVYFRTDEMIRKRSKQGAVWRQAKARFRYNTCSIRLNILKLAALSFRLMPMWIREFGYKRMR